LWLFIVGSSYAAQGKGEFLLGIILQACYRIDYLVSPAASVKDGFIGGSF